MPAASSSPVARGTARRRLPRLRDHQTARAYAHRARGQICRRPCIRNAGKQVRAVSPVTQRHGRSVSPLREVGSWAMQRVKCAIWGVGQKADTSQRGWIALAVISRCGDNVWSCLRTTCMSCMASLVWNRRRKSPACRDKFINTATPMCGVRVRSLAALRFQEASAATALVSVAGLCPVDSARYLRLRQREGRPLLGGLIRFR